MKASASRYIQRLAEVLESASVTERGGAPVDVDEAADRAVRMIRTAGESGGKVLIVANGGSAAIASHLQNDLCKACGVQALVFTETPLLTALSNDDGYETAYETLTRLWARNEDLLVAISSSGKSENILRAVQAAREAGAGVVTLSGFGDDNPLRSGGDLNFYVRSAHYGLVETAHAALCHYMSDAAGRLLDIDRGK